MPRIGILATHPVQYHAPWYRQLAEAVDLEVFYAHRQSAEEQAAAGFGVAFDWDVPLLQGYRYRFLANRARRPDVSTFFGCHTAEIGAIIRRCRFDAFIVHGWATRSYWQAITSCWATGTPILVRGDSQLTNGRSRGWRLAKYPLYRTFVPRFDGYLVVGARAREYLRHYGADPSRMFFAPHAADNGFFADRADALRGQRARLRATWDIPADATVFLFCGKVTGWKRPGDFVRAIAQASRESPSAWGLIAGDGALRTELEAAVRAARWPVRFAGFLNQSALPSAYAGADALVLPSEETWGLVVNEAMASGLPALVSDRVGCGPDLVQSGRTGDVFPFGDVQVLAGRIAALARDRGRLQAMGVRARCHVAGYSTAAAVRGTLEALARIGWRAGRVRPASQAAEPQPRP